MNSLHLDGRSALRTGELAEGQRLLEAALAEEPDNADIRTDLAWAYYRANDFSRAATVFERLPDWEPAVAKLRSFGDESPYQMRGPGRTELPFLLADPLPVVRITVESTEICALIDTGGGELILDVVFAEEIGTQLFGSQEGMFAGGKRTRVGHARVEHTVLGEIEVRRVPVRVLPIRHFSSVTGGRYRIDGVIGTNLLAQFRATVDYPGHRLVLERLGELEAVEGVEVPFETWSDHFMIADGSLNGVEPLRFFVDSGLVGGAFMGPERTLQAASIPVPETRITPGIGGDYDMAPFEIAELGLGPLRQRNLMGLFLRYPPDIPGEAGLDGLISHGFLRAYRWTIDPTRSVFVFS